MLNYFQQLIIHLDERVRMSAVPGDDGAPDPGHEGLPEEAVKRVHLLKTKTHSVSRIYDRR